MQYIGNWLIDKWNSYLEGDDDCASAASCPAARPAKASTVWAESSAPLIWGLDSAFLASFYKVFKALDAIFKPLAMDL